MVWCLTSTWWEWKATPEPQLFLTPVGSFLFSSPCLPLLLDSAYSWGASPEALHPSTSGLRCEECSRGGKDEGICTPILYLSQEPHNGNISTCMFHWFSHCPAPLTPSATNISSFRWTSSSTFLTNTVIFQVDYISKDKWGSRASKLCLYLTVSNISITIYGTPLCAKNYAKFSEYINPLPSISAFNSSSL